ncbi:hypothetical protein KI387_001611, partial [Taxus chinensis]
MDSHRDNKVETWEGPREQRIRLSSETAIKLYDIHDRLGFNQPTKSVEWLLRQAQLAINELPQISYPPLEHKDESEPEVEEKNMVNKRGAHSHSHSDSRTMKNITVERRAKARERARQRTLQIKRSKENLASLSQQYCEGVEESMNTSFPEGTIINRQNLMSECESSLNTFLQSPAQEDHICSGTATHSNESPLSSLASG